MLGLTALPAPGASPAPTGLAKLRQMLASDAAAIQPIRRIPDERERKRGKDGTEATGDALQGSGRADADTTAARARKGSGSSNGFTIDGIDDGLAGEGPVSPGSVALNALPNAGYVAQSIYQEAMGSGLTIEPWSDAIAAYRRADAGVNTPLLTQIAV
ncbi:hypothetical protein [Azospirillum picis]|uniref:Lytic transglycosylase domain-containing protein n=1 Tax=Azospirillum picis TaxID=488438 RepID=A0ABU0MFN9_9PROT|nr:hypothetical protein [Azospirillum picis]MBP2298701.1 hypothetical protein [Azospirillum picis]MDQ0532250.1 hypothetical protein [Azospirillum picis]